MQALARTIYSNARLVILDDCFVGLDGRTESYILDKLFGLDGVLSSRTTILATSSGKLVELLLIAQTEILAARYLALPNHVIIIDADCNVVQEGQHVDLALPVNQVEHKESQQQSTAPTSQQDDEFELLKAATDSDEVSKPASTELEVFRWYFQAAGGLNLIVFLTLCSVFVVGVIYPRTMLPSPT